MKHTIITTLGLLAAVTGLSSSVQARPLVPNAQTGNFSLTKNSVVEVESRTIGDDYQKFFGVKTSTNIPISNAEANNFFVYADGDDGVWQINDNLRLLVNEPLSPAVNPVSFSQDEASFFGDINRIEVQTNLRE